MSLPSNYFHALTTAQCSLSDNAYQLQMWKHPINYNFFSQLHITEKKAAG